MATQPQLNLNQFKMQPLLGMQALGIGSPPLARSVVVSPNQATTLVPGQAIQYDTTVLTNGLPAIVAATGLQYADGYVLYSIKNGGVLFTAGDILEILLQGAMWMMCEGTTIDQGNTLQDGADAGGMAPFATTGYFPRGIALDYAAGAGTLFRADLTPFTSKSAQAAAHT